MDASTSQPLALEPFCSLELADVPAEAHGGVEDRLDAVMVSLSAAVPSLWGVEVVVVRAGRPVVVTVRRDPEGERAGAVAVTSLRVPLRLLAAGSEAGSHVVVHASTPGALVDLAADAAYVLGPHVLGPHVLGPDVLVLDDDVPPAGLPPGVLGLAELAAVERAYGVLIERGHPPEDVEELLRRRAAVAGLEPYALALEALASAHPEPLASTS